jgi:uncharacterized protein YciI
MIQFMIVAYDGTDSGAAARRQSAKDAHVALGKRMITSGNILFSTAILNDDEETVGSMRVMQFESRSQLDDWLEREPYVTDRVWQKVEIKRCRMGPAFEWMTLEPGGRLEPS